MPPTKNLPSKLCRRSTKSPGSWVGMGGPGYWGLISHPDHSKGFTKESGAKSYLWKLSLRSLLQPPSKMSKPPCPGTTAHQRPHLALVHEVSPSSQPGLWGCVSDPWTPLLCLILLLTTQESWAWFHPGLPLLHIPEPFLRVSPPSCLSASWGRGASSAISQQSLFSPCQGRCFWLLRCAWNFILRLPRYSPRSIRVLAFPF